LLALQDVVVDNVLEDAAIIRKEAVVSLLRNVAVLLLTQDVVVVDVDRAMAIVLSIQVSMIGKVVLLTLMDRTTVQATVRFRLVDVVLVLVTSVRMPRWPTNMKT
jgi:hypothetical protein